MNRKMKWEDSLHTDDVWNAVVSVISEYDFPVENKIANEAYTIFQYYSELESGGHESLFTWFSDYIEEVGITNYLQQLIDILEKVGAFEYASIEKRYGKEMWNLFIALENEEIKEDEFYRVIELADGEYNYLNGQLENLLETYFVSIHTDLIDVVKE